MIDMLQVIAGAERRIHMVYEVHSNYGGAIFKDEDDAIAVLWLLAAYHDIKIDREDVIKSLEKESFFENPPLTIIKCY